MYLVYFVKKKQHNMNLFPSCSTVINVHVTAMWLLKGIIV